MLGVKTQQVNGDFTYPSGISDNQLHAWNQLNLFDQDVGNPSQLIRNVPLDDPQAIQAFKVRSYLDANCSYCHQPGGVDGAFDARITSPLAMQGLINQPTISAASKNSVVVLPGDTIHSELWVRDNSVGDIAMPPLAKNIVHQAYMDVLSDWIMGLESPSLDILGEVGTATIDHNWTSVVFTQTYTDPVIVAGAPSFNDTQAVTVRVRNLSPGGCEIRLDAWQCQPQTHALETIHYLVMESGSHTLANGKKIQAGKIQSDMNLRTHPFPESFSETPAFLAQVVSENEAVAVISRLDHRQTNASQFQFRLQEQEGSDGIHAIEIVCWVAAESGNFDGYLPFEIKRLPLHVEEFWTPIHLEQDYETAPLFLGHISSNHGGDVCALRYRQTTASSVEIFLEEEQCGDQETGHYLEDVHYFAFASPGLFPLEQVVPSLASQRELSPSIALAEEPYPSFNLYPNPVTYGDDFYIEWYEKSLGQAHIQLFSLDGTLAYEDSKAIHAGINRWKVPSHKLPKGLYTLKVLSPQGAYMKRLLLN